MTSPTFHRIVRDVVAETVTTETLTVRRTLKADTIDATTVNVPTSGPLFILDDNEVFGPGTGAIWSFTRIGNLVVAQLDSTLLDLAVNTNFLQYQIPEPYAPTANNSNTTAIAMCINNGGTFYGALTAASGVLQISPLFGSVFNAGEDVGVFSTTISYILI